MVSDRPEQSTGHAFLHKQVYSLPFREIPQIKKADFILSEILTRFSKKKWKEYNMLLFMPEIWHF